MEEELIHVTVDFGKSLQTLRVAEKIVANQKAYHLFRTMARALFSSWWGETFALEGRRRGHPKWKPLNPRYAAWKRRHGKGRGILRLTGHLAGSPEILQETKKTMRWGTKVPYAPHHQNPRVSGRPPKREMIFITNKDKSEVADFTRAFIKRVIDTE